MNGTGDKKLSLLLNISCDFFDYPRNLIIVEFWQGHSLAMRGDPVANALSPERTQPHLQ